MKQFNLEEYIANPNKKLITRDGRKVKRILCTDLKSRYPVVAVIEDHDGTEYAGSFTKDGEYFRGSSENIDLFFAPDKHEGWINVFKYNFGEPFIGDLHIFSTKEEAEKSERNNRAYLKSIKIEWEE